MKRKVEAIDLMKLYSQGSHNGWNEFLTKSYNTNDVNGLGNVRYAIQVGMDNLSKAKLNTEQMTLFYIRLNRSIELTVRKILKKRHKDKQILEQQFQGFLKWSSF